MLTLQSGRGSLFDYGAQLDGCTDDCDGTTFRNPSNELRDLSSTTQSRNHSLDTPRIPDISDFGLAYATPEGMYNTTIFICVLGLMMLLAVC